MNNKFKHILIGFAAGVFFVISLAGGAIIDRKIGFKFLDRFVGNSPSGSLSGVVENKILNEESVVTGAVEKAAPSVVTVGISKVQLSSDIFNFSPFDPFGIFNLQPKQEKVEQDIGSGFIVDSAAGLIVTNKHVVSDTTAKYRIIDKDNKVFEVKDIYRDPANDLAILRVEGLGQPAMELGDSDKLKVGQTAIAIGTALGEFRHTVTVGVISGLGRGISAGSVFEGSVERLDNVIQTDAAINPGNSGGPLLNSLGQVIGVSVAIAQQGQNIGFAIPINVVKDSLSNFHTTGEFERPYLGVRYQMLSKQAALLNEVPQGAYVREVIDGSPAQKAGIETGDIITYIDGQKLEEGQADVISLINKKKVGDEVEIKIWRQGEEKTLKIRLEKNS